MISDVVFLCLASICIYLIITTMMEKNILNLGQISQNKLYKKQQNTKTKSSNSKKSSSSYKNVSESKKTESFNILNESLTEQISQNVENNQEHEQKFISEDEAGVRTGGALVYPESLRYESQDTIKLTALEYRASGFNTGQINSAGERPSTKTAKRLGTVILPIPAGIESNNTTRYTDGEMSGK